LESPTAVFDPIVTTAVLLPNGLAYHFFYTDYGELARVELPTGGVIEYDYAAGAGTYGTSVVPMSAPEVYRITTHRREYDYPGHLESRQTFSYGMDSNGFLTITSVATSDSAHQVRRERHTFNGTIFEDFGYQGWYQAPDNGREKTVELLDTAGNVLRRID